MAGSFPLMEQISADSLLHEYAECADPERAEQLLETLVVEHAQPGIRRIVRHKLAFQGAAEAQDAEDVASEVLVELISRLRAMKTEDGAAAIGAFSGYTAVAAYHACNEYVRRKYPNRHRLKTRLRYLLGSDKELALWEAENSVWMCGLERWRNAAAAPATAEQVARWPESLGEIPRHSKGQHPADTVTLVLGRLGRPVELEELVAVMARVWGVEDAPPAPEYAARELEAADPDPAAKLDLQRWLAGLWTQIRELPVAQRVALLLNLRAGGDHAAVTLLPLTGVAGMREIAETLELPPLEFAELWNRLPLDDLSIAERLGVSRQRVINLRKSARERLTRRMGGIYRNF